MRLPKFYMGTHRPNWLEFLKVSLCVSRRQLEKRKTMPRACRGWMLDSGGFTEISMNGRWTISERAYVNFVKRCVTEIGKLDFVAPMDWMCEPFILDKTGFTVKKHQRLTVDNFIELKSLDPNLPFFPVLQGWKHSDYIRHVDMYYKAGIDLAREPLVGVGSVCRRHSTDEVLEIVTDLASLKIKIHGFGVKTSGLARLAKHITSFDSMAWSFRARHLPPLPGCTTHKNCANCYKYALVWRDELIAKTKRKLRNDPRPR